MVSHYNPDISERVVKVGKSSFFDSHMLGHDEVYKGTKAISEKT
ncbi:hypothetical protein LSO9J_50041 [Candidatus Liberibacter solanacearum]